MEEEEEEEEDKEEEEEEEEAEERRNQVFLRRVRGTVNSNECCFYTAHCQHYSEWLRDGKKEANKIGNARVTQH